MYQLAVQDRKDNTPGERRTLAYGHSGKGARAPYVLGILIDAVSRSCRPSEVTGHVLEVAQRAEVDGDHAEAAALRTLADRLIVAQAVRGAVPS